MKLGPRWLLAACLIFHGCSPVTADKLDALYEQALSELRSDAFEQAGVDALQGISLAARRGDPWRQWRFRLLLAESYYWRSKPKESLAQIADAMPASSEFGVLRARKLLIQSRLARYQKRPSDARALFDQAKQAANALPPNEASADIAVTEGNALTMAGRYSEAEPILRGALQCARAAKSSYAEAGALVNLGMIRLRQNHLDDAAAYFERASERAGLRAGQLYSMAQTDLAECLSGLGEHERAIRIQLATVARCEGATYLRSSLASALGGAGHAYMVKGEWKTAVPYLERALRIHREMNLQHLAAVWAGNLASSYGELGDWDNASRFNQEAIALKRAAHTPTLFYNVLNAARIAAGRGEAATSARLYRLAMEQGSEDTSVVWDAREGLGTLALNEGHPEEAVRHFEAAVTIVEESRAVLMRTDFKLSFLTRLIRLYQQYVNILIRKGDWEGALAVADSSRAQVLASTPNSAPIRRLPARAFRKLARDANAVMLSYWLGPDRSYVWVVTADGIHHAELPPASTIEPLVAAFRDAVERQLADPMRARLAPGEQLFQMLLEPVRRWIPAGSRVVIAPDGALHGLNLEALPVPATPPRYWLEEVTVEIAPSLAVLANAAPPKAGERRLLLLGDPAGAQPSLRYAAAEMESVRRGFAGAEQAVFRGLQATPEAYRAAGPGRFSAIHFAAHAAANRENPLESAVLLANGKLYAREVMDSPLAADLVTVSSCRGAGSRTFSGEGLVGFAWAFLRAGARHVIAGLWEVDDQSTSLLMDVLYREMAAGKTPGAALRTAKLALMATGGNFRKPYYWAPFQLYTAAP